MQVSFSREKRDTGYLYPPCSLTNGVVHKKIGGVPLRDAPMGWGVLTNQGKLDFSYEIETRLEGVGSRRPVCWANLITVFVYKFGC